MLDLCWEFVGQSAPWSDITIPEKHFMDILSEENYNTIDVVSSQMHEYRNKNTMTSINNNDTEPMFKKEFTKMEKIRHVSIESKNINLSVNSS